ncbi:tRNA uridine-5-carboxymethylaminomethyl(34) synthesis GTPase MnmE [Salidesulfovibrio onnuriiensis]|uniref:tRNA uridine-5-carboxymethylaminomethyl(34) synthesis GTPase MnmE n=1 Tax=Salidesulfovibrio onnuriiensis TaxID=2583823 RepID=UPI0011CA733B|nr:tRNA uridine-5-carboxymethylaminomethyl(34) synthesis GTPase MnmE [Salidesulfovibrio onnuriiensis]
MSDAARRKDTIAAVATPPGQGGVGIIRISGPKAVEIAAELFRATREDFTNFKPYRLHHGTVADSGGKAIDEVLAAFMPGPKSYTGEDTIEFNCHGGQAILAAVLEECLDRGARLADRGEFTLRAYLNGRMDLTQAEAVAELIHAPSKAAMHLAQVKLSGVLGQKIDGLRKRLEELRAQLCVAVDFPEEELECLPMEELARTSSEVREEISALLTAVERTKAWREGALVVLAGMVNAGKSSLMNALLGRNRAIVTEIPGTTRDYLEESLNLGGLTVRLADTAGLRSTGDSIEEAGIEKGRELMEQADLILYVVDNSETIAEENMDAATQLDPAKTIAVMNKMDVIGAEPPPWKIFKRWMFEIVKVSAKSGKNLDKLAGRMRERLLEGAGQPDPDELVPNARQAQVLKRAAQELEAMEADATAGVPYDLLGVRLETACNVLAGITGRITSEEVLDSIFDNFCIGK